MTPSPSTGTGTNGARPANRFGLDYRVGFARLGPPTAPIIDAHTHVNGARAATIFRDVADRAGIAWTLSQTLIEEAGQVRDVLGDRVGFIAIPRYQAPDRVGALTTGFLDDLERWHGEFGARCVKLWAAPRLIDLVLDAPQPAGFDPRSVLDLDGAWRVRVADRAAELGMMFMVHVADPDTWFATRYADRARYGAKIDHYAPLERMIERYPVPWIAAHMGGWPEDLGFLDGLLERHDRLHLDTSATKWMVRELGRHPRDRLLAFLERWRGRIIFGSDIVTSDAHLAPTPKGDRRFGVDLAGSEEEALELYASRYWALRMMWESDHDGESPIADPDLAMVDPARHTPMDAPRLVGRSLPPGVLRPLYRDAAEALLADRYPACRSAAVGPGAR